MTSVPVTLSVDVIPASIGGPALSLVQGVHVPISDVAGAPVVYLLPHPIGGDVVALPNGADRETVRYAETPILLTAAGHPANTAFDVWVSISGGVLCAGTAAWANSGFGVSSRGTGAGSTEVEFWQGQWVNKNPMTIVNGTTSTPVDARCALLVGSFKTTIAGATEDSRAKRLLSSLFAPAMKPLQRSDAALTWSYSAAAYRTANGNPANVVETFQCMAGRAVHIIARSLVVNSTSLARIAASGIGMHSSTDISTTGSKAAFENTKFVTTEADFDGYCPLGAEEWRWLECGSGSDAHTWFGAGSGYKTGLGGHVLI